jgi:hypothetical protein
MLHNLLNRLKEFLNPSNNSTLIIKNLFDIPHKYLLSLIAISIACFCYVPQLLCQVISVVPMAYLTYHHITFVPNTRSRKTDFLYKYWIVYSHALVGTFFIDLIIGAFLPLYFQLKFIVIGFGVYYVFTNQQVLLDVYDEIIARYILIGTKFNFIISI